jgi:hypothetical protein
MPKSVAAPMRPVVSALSWKCGVSVISARPMLLRIYPSQKTPALA